MATESWDRTDGWDRRRDLIDGHASDDPPPAPSSPSPSPSSATRPPSAPPSPMAAPPPSTPRASAPPVGPPPARPGVHDLPARPAAHPFNGAPAAPPARHRPDNGAGRPVAPPLVEIPPAPEAPAPPTSVTPGGAWGWRALVAFLAGGVLTGAGFAIATLSDDGPGVDSAATAPTTEPPPVTTPSTAAADPAPAPTAPEGEEAAAFVARELGPSVVQLETTFGIGSGVVYSEGLILTNTHVVTGAENVIVQLSDGRRVVGEVVGSDTNVDIAVVSVDPSEELPVAPLALGSRPEVGSTAIAIGSPFRLQQTVTQGIVSAVNRPVRIGEIFTAMIQTDTPINPGNSGGALADRSGQVIGIVTLIQADVVSNDNAVGFAIPIDTAVSVADRLVAGIPIESGFLGVAGAPALDGEAGVEVTTVTPGSAAEAAGIQVGDLIVAIDDAPVTEFEELAGLVVARAPGDVVVLEMIRNGQPLTVEATLSARDN